MSFKRVNEGEIILPSVPIVGIVFHWSAGVYGQFHEHYHFCVDQFGRLFQNMDGLPGMKLPHTWNRNSGRIAISAAAMAGANEYYYGDYPVTRKQLEAMAKLGSILVRKYGLRIQEPDIRTHCEWAIQDGYGPGSGDPQTRWEYWHTPQFDRSGRGLCDDFERDGGAWLRRKIEWYYRQSKPKK